MTNPVKAEPVARLVNEIIPDLNNIVRAIVDEGDRCYLGSTNDADHLREVADWLETRFRRANRLADDGLAARLEEWLERIQEGDRPLPWVVHSGCSYRRIASEPTPESDFRSFPDGNVLHAYNQRSDGHPDLSMGEKQLSALVEIVNNLPAIITALRAQSDAEVERIAALGSKTDD